MALVVHTLTKSGAGIIGFDIVFADEDRLSPHKMAKLLNLSGNYVNNDEVFSNLLLQTPTILGYYFDMAKSNQGANPIDKAKISIYGYKGLDNFNNAKGLINNIDILKNNAYSSGFFNLTDIQNAIVNKDPLLIKYKNNLYPSLAFEMLRIASQSETIKVHNSELGVIALELDALTIPTDSRAQIKLNFRGKSFSFKYISFLDIYTNNFNPNDINGKFILIRTSDIGLSDKVATLYDPEMPGVEIHATIIDNILNSDFFFTPINAYSYSVFLIFFSTIILSNILYFLSPLYSFIAFLLSLAIVLYINYYLIFNKHIIINYSIILLSLFITTGIYYYKKQWNYRQVYR